jgi:hemolysin activation/secretion protein
MIQRYLKTVWIIPLALGCQLGFPQPLIAEQLRIVEAPPLAQENAQGVAVDDAPQGQQQLQPAFTIGRFVITGSGLFSDSDLQEQLRQFTGRNRTAADREAARYTLERFFHDQGYRTVTVSLPEQPPGERVVRLLVNENRTDPGAAAQTPSAAAQPLSATAQPMIVEAPAGSGEAPAVNEQPAGEESAKPDQQTFTIRRFAIEGTALFRAEELQQQVRQYLGRGRTAADVEGARDVLERFFHDQGYPTVMVNIPEQSVQNKVIRLEVIENRVGTVTLTGNSWFTTEKIMAELPSIAPGQVIKLQELQQEINRINRNPDFKVIPDMQPGKTPETVDLSLKVEDSLPLHGSLEINNRSSHDTTATRLLASLRYDNLWQREHSLSAQYQISPQNTSQVQVASGSYSLPAPWNRDDRIVLYGVWSNSDTTSVGDYKTIGKGYILGTRVIVPMRAIGDYNHTAVLGFDYKDFEETGGLLGSSGLKTPVSYSPLSLAYSAVMRDEGGQTSFNSAVNLSFRGAVANERQFEEKRYK